MVKFLDGLLYHLFYARFFVNHPQIWPWYKRSKSGWFIIAGFTRLYRWPGRGTVLPVLPGPGLILRRDRLRNQVHVCLRRSAWRNSTGSSGGISGCWGTHNLTTSPNTIHNHPQPCHIMSCFPQDPNVSPMNINFWSFWLIKMRMM